MAYYLSSWLATLRFTSDKQYPIPILATQHD